MDGDAASMPVTNDRKTYVQLESSKTTIFVRRDSVESARQRSIRTLTHCNTVRLILFLSSQEILLGKAERHVLVMEDPDYPIEYFFWFCFRQIT